MGLQTNFFVEVATYAWRKRLPVQLGGGLMQISQRTNKRPRNRDSCRSYCVCRMHAYV